MSELILHLNQRNISVIAHIADQDNTTIFAQALKSAQELNIPPHWHQIWNNYIAALVESHIRIKEGPDEIMWCLSKNGAFNPKSGYLGLINYRQPENAQDWWQAIWKLKTPSRTKLFFWCVLSNKVPIGDSLTHRAIHRPHWCVLCKQAFESTDHIFLKCDATVNLWRSIVTEIQFIGRWEGENINQAWEN